MVGVICLSLRIALFGALMSIVILISPCCFGLGTTRIADTHGVAPFITGPMLSSAVNRFNSAVVIYEYEMVSSCVAELFLVSSHQYRALSFCHSVKPILVYLLEYH